MAGTASSPYTRPSQVAALMAAAIVALVRSRAVRPRRSRRIFGGLAIDGIVLTVPGELALIPVAGANVNSAAASAVTTMYGIAVLLTDIGHLAVHGAGRPPAPQRRSRAGTGQRR